MDDVEESLLEWVRLTQVNSTLSKQNLESLDDLADGVALFSMLAQT